MVRGLLGIEITERVIRYVYLVKDQGKYRIDKAGQVVAKGDLSAPATVEGEIRRLVGEQQLSPRRIFVTVARRDSVIHQILLPRMTAVELNEAVSGEINKIPVFFHRPFDYIYKSYPQDKGKTRLIFAAMAASVLDGIIKGVRRTKIPFHHLDIAPLNLKEILPRMPSSRADEGVLVITDQHTYFGILEDRQYSFFYKSSMGIEQFAAAAGSSTAREHVIANWTAELKRVLKAYLLEHKKEKLGLIWLVWDKTRLPDLDRRLCADLDTEVEVLYLKKIPGLKIVDELSMNPIYALALTPVIIFLQRVKAVFPLNHFFRGPRLRRYILRTAAAVLLFLLLAGTAFFKVSGDIRAQNDRLAREAEAMAAQTQTLTLQSQDLFRRHAAYAAVRRRLLDQATYVQRLNRISWTQVLSLVARELPEDIGLTLFRLNEAGIATIQGDALHMEPVSELLRRIEGSAILEEGKFSFLREREVRQQKFYSFGIIAHLKAMEESQP